MHKTSKVVVLLGLGILAIVAGGCQSSQQVNSRKARLLADENRRLKRELAEYDRVIEEKDKLLAQAEQEKTVQDEQTSQSVSWLLDMVTDFEKKNTTLAEENDRLKTQIQELEEQVKSFQAARQNTQQQSATGGPK